VKLYGWEIQFHTDKLNFRNQCLIAFSCDVLFIARLSQRLCHDSISIQNPNIDIPKFQNFSTGKYCSKRLHGFIWLCSQYRNSHFVMSSVETLVFRFTIPLSLFWKWI